MTIDLRTAKKWVGVVLLILFMLVVMLDPTNTILALKGKVFAVVLAYNLVFFRPSFRFLPHILMVFFAVTAAYVSGVMQCNEVDFSEVLGVYKAFSPLLLLLWVHHYDYTSISIFPAFVTALLVVVLFFLCASGEDLEYLIYHYMKEHDDTAMVGHRYFMGMKMFSIYYKSFVCLAFGMFYFIYKAYNVSRWRWLTLWPALVFVFAFLISGTRATMLLPFFLIGVVGYKSVTRMGKMKYIFYPLVAVFALLLVTVIVMLAMEKGEASNVAKYAHLFSYQELFDNNPIYFLFGQGIGTRFYTLGFHRFVFITEWTYVELLRNFGLFSLLILFVELYPLYHMWKHRRDSYTFGIMGTYVAYVLVAGTNPLLVSSTGMQMLLCAYSFICRLPASAPQEVQNR